MFGTGPRLEFVLSVSLSITLFAFVVVIASMLFAFVLRWRDINEYYRHPLIDKVPFKSLSFSMQASVYLDIFLRLMLPKKTSGITGNANRLLKHVNPREVPFSMRWPIAGFWGGIFLGLAAQIVFFGLLFYLKV